MTIDRVNDSVHHITFNDGRELMLIGTAHVSKDSVDTVKENIETFEPDHICIELDKGRYGSKKNNESWSASKISNVIKKGQGFLLLANMALASFQKRMGNKTGITPGEEIMSAAQIAEEKGIPFSLCDRDITLTFKRAWRKSSFWNKMKLLATLISAAFSNEEITEEELEDLKKEDMLQSMMKEMAKELPTVKEVLIDERDRYLATSIYKAPGNKKLAVVGAGHAPGLMKTLEKLEAKEMSDDLTEISAEPPAGKGGKIVSFLIPTIIIAMIVAGVAIKGWSDGLTMFLYWVAANAIFTGIGSIAALAHPVNFIVSMIAAPFTALSPTIGVGFVTGLLELKLRPPKVRDSETLSDDVMHFRRWYKNSILHSLLVFFFSSLGSMIGTFVAFPFIISMFA